MKTLVRVAYRNVKCLCVLLALGTCTYAHTIRPIAASAGGAAQILCVTNGREKELFEAIKRKDSGRVKALLAAGVSPNAQSEIKYGAWSPESPTCAPALMHAARAGDVKTVEMLLTAKADVKARDAWGRLVWGYALDSDLRLLPPEQIQEALNTRLQLSKMLVAAGAPLDLSDRDWGETALFHAADVGVLTGDLRILNALIAAGAPVNVQGVSILAYVTMKAQLHELEADFRPGPKAVGAVAVMKTLLRARADVNARFNGTTALIMEAGGMGLPGPLARLRILLDGGADPNAQYEQTGDTPLLAALRADQLFGGAAFHNHTAKALADQAEAVDLLLKAGADPNRKSKAGDSPLHIAVYDYIRYYTRDTRPPMTSGVISKLLAAGADVNARDAKGRTALVLALAEDFGDSAQTGYQGAKPELVKFLVAAGADVNAPVNDKRTPLWVAIGTYGSITDEVLRILLAAGADPNARDPHGRTLLMEAINRPPETLRLLIEAKAEVNARDPEGNTALSLSLKSGRSVDHVTTLLAAGASASLRYESGDTALILAAKTYDPRWMADSAPIFSALFAAGADARVLNDEGESALTIMVTRHEANSLSAVRVLLDAGRRDGARSLPRAVDLIAAIKRAAGRSRGDIVQELIAAGADVNCADETGRPPLIVAVTESGSVDVVRALLAAGARVNARDKDGDTALTAAIREYLTGGDEIIKNALYRDTEIIRVLIAAGADTRARGKDGSDARALAKESRNDTIIALVKRGKAQR